MHSNSNQVQCSVRRRHARKGREVDGCINKVKGFGWAKFNTEVDEFIEHLEPDLDSIERKDINCQVCGVNFNTNNHFKDHKKIHNPALIKFTCIYCEDKFVVEAFFKNHMMSHKLVYSKSDNGPFRCNVCSKTFIKKKELKSHLLLQHPKCLEKCNFCEFCPEFFISKQSKRGRKSFSPQK